MLKHVLMTILLLSAGNAFAQDKSTGCGPGWYVTKSYTWLATTTRNTTNSYIQPFATTTGTSGCTKHSIVQNDKRSFDFLDTNYDQLAQEAAQGGGEYLAALARSLGCGDRHMAAFEQGVHADYAAIFAAQESEASFLALREAMARNVSLSGCRVGS